MKRHKNHKQFIVYCAKFPNGLKYYGVTGRSLKERIKDHKNSKRNNPFHNALKKHFDKVIWGVIKTFDDCETAYCFEQRIIKSVGVYPNSYNYTLGGGYASGYKLKPRSEEFRKMLSERGKKLTGKNNPFYGKVHTEETKKLISKALKGQPGQRAKPVIDQFGKWYRTGQDAADALGISRTSVSLLVKNKKESIKGVKLCFAQSI